MANVRYYQHTALSGALAADDRVPMDKKTGASSFATRYFTPAQMAAFVESGLGAAAISNDYNDLSNLPDLSAYVPNTRTVNGHALSADVTITPSDLGLVIGADVQAFDADLSAIAALTPSNDDIIQRKAGAWTNRTPAQFKTDLALVKADVGLGNVEDTALSTWAGSTNLITLGTVTTGVWNGTAIAYANLSLTGSIVNADISNSAAIAYSKLNLTGAILNADLAGSIANAKLANSAITIAGTSTSLGGSISLDTITGLSSTGIVKRTGANTLAIATSGTDYAPATSGTAILKGNGSGGFSNASGGTDYEVPLTFSTGLTRSTNTITVNTSQNIATLSNLTSNGFVKTIGGAGTLSVDTTSYVPTTTTVAGNALSGNISAATLTASLNAFTGDSGSGGMKGLVPAPASGDAAAGKYLKADGTWATVSGGGGITIGTTTVTGATDTYALYNNAGVVGARAVTGTGNAVLSTSPTITTPAITTSATVTNNALGTSTAAGVALTNTTAAAAGAQQVSPAMIWTGQGWKTNATAASQTVNWQAYVLPVQGSANPTANWILRSQINGGGYTDRLTVDSAGVVYYGDTSAANISPAANGLLFGTINKRAYIGGTNTSGLSGVLVSSTSILGFSSDGSVTGFTNQDLILRRAAAANLAFGATDAASPVAQTQSVQNVASGTSNTAGADWTRAASRSTGNAIGGAHVWQVSPAGTSGTSQNALVEAMRIKGTGVLQFPTTITAGGTTGNQTIDKLTGTVNIAAAGTSVTVTNALVTTSSIVFAVIRTNDTTAVIKNVVPSSGSFVITLNAAATAEVSIGFIVFNS